MRPISHVLISGGVTAIFSLWARSWTAALACFLSGILIDLDHHLDYFLARKKLPFNYKKVVHFLMNENYPKVKVFLHSYELIALWWVAIFVFGLNYVWKGVAIGFTTHILCDVFANPLKPSSYFLTYRILNRFERERLFKK